MAKAVVPYDIPDFANLLRIMLRTVKKLRRVIRLISLATSAVVPHGGTEADKCETIEQYKRTVGVWRDYPK